MLKQLMGAQERKKTMLTPIKMLPIRRMRGMLLLVMTMGMLMKILRVVMVMVVTHLLVLLLLAIFLASRCEERLDKEALPKLWHTLDGDCDCDGDDDTLSDNQQSAISIICCIFHFALCEYFQIVRLILKH